MCIWEIQAGNTFFMIAAISRLTENELILHNT